MSKPRILVTRQTPGPDFERLSEACDVVMWEQDTVMPREKLLAQVGDVVGLLCTMFDQVNQELLDAAPNLKMVSNYAVGLNNIDLPACTARGIPVGHTPGVVTEATADTAFGLMLGISRRIHEAARYVDTGQWKDWSPTLLIGNDLYGKTLGIVGMGRIGQAVARRAKGFSMRVLYHNRRQNPGAEQDLGVEYATLDVLLAQSDLVVLTVPYSPETHHIMNASSLAKMKSSAFLINVARGAVVDQGALATALAAGTIRGAGLDVTDPEPILANDPLLKMDNCLIIPHIATSTWETRADMTRLAVENLLRGLQGEPLAHCANPEVA